MQHVGMVMVVAALVVPVYGQTPATTGDLAFLTGCWKLESNGRVVEEHWLAPAGGSLMGVSRTIAKGKMVEYEFLQILDLPEGLTYVARPSGQPEAKFRATTKTANEIVFENPAHDFPQRVRYRLTGTTLNARIEGNMNGKARGIDYPYSRVPCTP